MTLIKTKINLISLFDDEDEDVENENSNLKTIPNEIQEKLKNQNEFILFEHCLTIDNNNNNNNLTNDQNTNNNLYSTFTWRPCSSILSRFLLENENLISNKTVLELGCGTGLCGLICAKLCNAEKLILTDATIDYSHVKASVEHHEIDSKCEWFSWQWATFSKQILEYFKTTKIDLIIGSDCFYDNEGILFQSCYFLKKIKLFHFFRSL